MREKIQQHPLFVPISKSAHLLLWMMSCSGTDEQYFLNTCDTASYCVSISSLVANPFFFFFFSLMRGYVSLVARHSTICSLLTLSSTVEASILAKINKLSDEERVYPSKWPAYAPSVRYFWLLYQPVLTACTAENMYYAE